VFETGCVCMFVLVPMCACVRARFHVVVGGAMKRTSNWHWAHLVRLGRAPFGLAVCDEGVGVGVGWMGVWGWV